LTILINITLAKHGSNLPDDGLLTETFKEHFNVHFNPVVHSVG